LTGVPAHATESHLDFFAAPASSTMHARYIRIGRLLAALALCVALGGHWFVLQAVAWAGMLVTYAQVSGVAAAVEQTFDGEHPCSLCTQIEQGRKQEKQHGKESPRQSLAGELKFVLPVRVTVAAPAWQPVAWNTGAIRAEQRNSAPPTLPPRLA
jgi:hypothetical protein